MSNRVVTLDQTPGELVIRDSGWLSVSVADAEGGPVTVKLDTLRAYNRYAVIMVDPNHAGEAERAAAWIEYLVSCGLPRLSQTAAFQVAAAVIRDIQGDAQSPQAKSEGD